MWGELTKYLPTFKSAVLTGIDQEGYPFSVRCSAQIEQTAQVVRVVLASDPPWVAGRASLLCHDHDAQLWNQRSFLVRGSLAREGADWVLRPEQLIPGVGMGNILVGLVKFVISARRTAKRYLATRNLPRPKVPWNDIERVKANAGVHRRDTKTQKGK